MALGEKHAFWWPLVMGAVLLACGLAVYRGVDRLVSVQKELEQVVQTNRELQSRNEALHQRIIRLRGDKRAVEKEARLEMGLIRKDEVIYREAGPQNTSAPAKERAKP